MASLEDRLAAKKAARKKLEAEEKALAVEVEERNTAMKAVKKEVREALDAITADIVTASESLMHLKETRDGLLEEIEEVIGKEAVAKYFGYGRKAPKGTGAPRKRGASAILVEEIIRAYQPIKTSAIATRAVLEDEAMTAGKVQGGIQNLQGRGLLPRNQPAEGWTIQE